MDQIDDVANAGLVASAVVASTPGLAAQDARIMELPPAYMDGGKNGHYLLYLPDELAVGFRLSDEECSTIEAFVSTLEGAARAKERRAMTEKIGESAEAAGRPLGSVPAGS